MQKLNCRKGDIAVYNKLGIGESKTSKNLGKIMNCIELLPEGVTILGGYNLRDGVGRVWKVDCDVNWVITYTNGDRKVIQLPYAPDHCLTPLRDTDGEDETVQWAGPPPVLPQFEEV